MKNFTQLIIVLKVNWNKGSVFDQKYEAKELSCFNLWLAKNQTSCSKLSTLALCSLNGDVFLLSQGWNLACHGDQLVSVSRSKELSVACIFVLCTINEIYLSLNGLPFFVNHVCMCIGMQVWMCRYACIHVCVIVCMHACVYA